MPLFLWHYNKASDNAIVSWGRHTTRHSAPLIAFQLFRFHTAALVIKITFFFTPFFCHHERHPVLSRCVSVLYASDFTTEYAFHSRANRTVYTERIWGRLFSRDWSRTDPFLNLISLTLRDFISRYLNKY